MRAPIISVVVFAKNSADTIDRALYSICHEQSTPLELLVLDGGSTDGTLGVVEKYRRQIALLRSEPDGGPTNAINYGVRHATGDIISLVPGDDWLERDALARVADIFSKDRQLEILSCGARIARVGAGGQTIVCAEYCDQRALEFTLANILRHPLTGARFIRRAVYERLGGMDNRWTFPDKEFLLRACLGKPRSSVSSQVAFNFRRHSGSATNSLRPEMTMRMLSDNIRLSRHYLGAAGLTAADKRALLHLHAGSSARLAAMNAARGHVQDAGRMLCAASRTDSAWPLNAAIWYYGSMIHKLRHERP